MSLEEYREALDDQASTDEQIQRRLEYLEALCYQIIKGELAQFSNPSS